MQLNSPTLGSSTLNKKGQPLFERLFLLLEERFFPLLRFLLLRILKFYLIPSPKIARCFLLLRSQVSFTLFWSPRLVPFAVSYFHFLFTESYGHVPIESTVADSMHTRKFAGQLIFCWLILTTFLWLFRDS